MTLLNAITFANRVILARNSVLRSDYGRIVTAYNTLADSGHEEYFDLAERLRSHFGYVISEYDERGAYCGSVANENGWTA